MTTAEENMNMDVEEGLLTNATEEKTSCQKSKVTETRGPKAPTRLGAS